MKFFEFIVFGIFAAIGALATEIFFLYILPSPLPSDLPIESLVGIFYFLSVTSIVEEWFKLWALSLRRNEIASFNQLILKVLLVGFGFFLTETVFKLWKSEFDFSQFPIQKVVEIMSLHILSLGIGASLISIFRNKYISIPAVTIMATIHIIFNAMIHFNISDLTIFFFLAALLALTYFLYLRAKKRFIFSS